MAHVSPPLEAIVLAAGSGTRFGGGKLTHPWRGGALIDGALAAALAAPVRGVTLVTGADAGVAPAARAYAEGRGEAARLRIVHCARHELGMGESLACGARSLAAGAAGVFVFLGDMPLIPAGVARSLAEKVRRGAAAAAPAHAGLRGHPVLFGAELVPALRSLSGDAGARAILQGLGARLAIVPCDEPGVLVDVDRPDDLPAAGPGGPPER